MVPLFCYNTRSVIHFIFFVVFVFRVQGGGHVGRRSRRAPCLADDPQKKEQNKLKHMACKDMKPNVFVFLLQRTETCKFKRTEHVIGPALRLFNVVPYVSSFSGYLFCIVPYRCNI